MTHFDTGYSRAGIRDIAEDLRSIMAGGMTNKTLSTEEVATMSHSIALMETLARSVDPVTTECDGCERQKSSGLPASNCCARCYAGRDDHTPECDKRALKK